jgi:hypothetical protein
MYGACGRSSWRCVTKFRAEVYLPIAYWVSEDQTSEPCEKRPRHLGCRERPEKKKSKIKKIFEKLDLKFRVTNESRRIGARTPAEDQQRVDSKANEPKIRNILLKGNEA